MKRKKTAAAPAHETIDSAKTMPVSAPADSAAAALLPERLTRRDMTEIVLFCILTFVGMTLLTVPCTLALLVVAVLGAVGKAPWKRLRGWFCVPTLCLLAYAVVVGFAAIYTPFDALAMQEYPKVLTAFALAALALARFEKKHVRALLWGLTIVCAVVALLSLDMATLELLYRPFNAVTSLLGMDYTVALEGSRGGRINGLFNNGNVNGAMFSMNIFTCLYLMRSEKTRWKTFAASFLLGFFAVSLLLTVSRGAMLCFAVTLLVYLAVERGGRVRLLMLCLAVGAALVCTGLPAAMTLTGASIIPVLCACACGPVIYLLDWALGDRLTAVILGHKKASGIAAGVAAVAAVAFVVLATQMHTPAVFTSGSANLLRALSVEPGEYTLVADWDGGDDLTVDIYSSTYDQVRMDTYTVHYSGPLSGASFTMPEDAVVVRFNFIGTPGCTLRSAALSDGTEINMAYRFIPEVLASRFQTSMLYDHSFTQRVQYLADAWAIFLKNPLLGCGLGSSEGLFTSVQPYYYESKYVHNHVLQTLGDTGLLGFVSFFGMMLAAAWLLIRRLREQADGLASMLLAVLVMMNLHSLIELNFSVRPFVCVAFLFVVLVVLAYAKPLAETVKGGRSARKTAERLGGVFAVGMCLYMVVFGGLIEVHRMVQREANDYSTSSVEDYLDTMKTYASLDVFDNEELKVSFISQAVHTGNSRFTADLQRYVRDLLNYNTFSARTSLAFYYYFPLGDFEQGFASSRAAIAQKASDVKAWNHQTEFYKNGIWPVVDADNVDAYVDGVLLTKAYLESYNDGRIDPVVISEENQAFLELVATVRENGLSGEVAYLYLAAKLDQ